MELDCATFPELEVGLEPFARALPMSRSRQGRRRLVYQTGARALRL